MAWASVASGGVSLLGGFMGSRSSKRAADAQIQAAQQGINEQRRQYDLTRADNAPFRDTGVFANARLRQLLGLDKDYTGSDSGSLTRQFNQSDLEGDAVYQNGLEFGRNQGTEAINSRALAGGGYDSGATLKALTQFGNDYGNTKANESYNRYNNDQSNVYNKLAGVSGAGQQATNSVSAAGQNMANNISNSYADQGNSRAAGIVAGANAWNNAIGGASSAFTNYQDNQFFKGLMRQRGGK